MNHIMKICLGLATALGINGAVAEPIVPGFNVKLYAEVLRPHKLAFDPSGILYAGNDANTGADKIHRIGLRGSSVEEYGDTPLADPDSVAFDSSGAISGIPGSVLVGDRGNLVAIYPDQTTVTILSGLGNLAYLEFDRTTRLLMADQERPFRLLATTGGQPIELGNAFLSVTVDGANRIYSAFNLGQVQVIAPDGTLLPDLVSNSELGFFRGLEFGPYNSEWQGELIAVSSNKNLYRIAPDGSTTLLGSFDEPGDIAFGPDGALYVSEITANKIYRITPADVLNVSIDIKPGSNKNPVNPKSKGKLKVAVTTTDEFDASTVDPDSVLFGPGEAVPVWYRLDDVDHDGDLDLVLKFNILETGIACGDTEATLIGETFDGFHFIGTDSIKTVGCELKKCDKKEHHYKHSDDDCDDDKKHHGRHKEKWHHERHYSKHHDDDSDDDHKKR